MPEPWTGHIDRAPILFIASNPGINTSEYYPRNHWEDDHIADFFTRRFDPGAGYTHQRPDGGAQYAKVYGAEGLPVIAPQWVRFWSGVKNCAAAILGRQPTPGADYALTEMVHCKSNDELGVRDAVVLCASQWMPPIVAHSNAVVLVLLGQHAHQAASALWGIDPGRTVHLGLSIGGRVRALVLLPHTNARGLRKIDNHVAPSDLETLRALVSKN